MGEAGIEQVASKLGAGPPRVRRRREAPPIHDGQQVVRHQEGDEQEERDLHGAVV